MESYLYPSSEDIRISTSPRRSPQITDGLKSPARSFHPQIQQMESMHSQPDYGLRTTDFFDNSSDDDSPGTRSTHDVTLKNESFVHQDIATKMRHSGLPDEPVVSTCERRGSNPPRPDWEGYQPLTEPPILEDDIRGGYTPSSSAVGSVDELLPEQAATGPSYVPSQPHRSSVPANRFSTNTGSAGDRASTFDQTLGAYAIAHNITLQALLRDESALDKSPPAFPLTQNQAGDRRSRLAQSIPRQIDPKTAQVRPFSSPREHKKVHVAPPPIDTSAPRRSLPQDLVRTPYPFSPEPVHHKENDQEKHVTYSTKPASTTESVLTLSIRQSNPNSRSRATTVAIPASNDFSVVRSHSPRSKEQHFKALDFDDEALFRQIRKSYHQLMGPLRILSARSLRRISVSGPAMQETDRGYWLQPPRSPSAGAPKGVSGTVNKERIERIMQYYRNPALGKSRYAFVHWVHRLAAANSSRAPLINEDHADSFGRDNFRRMEHPEGLAFVVSWSWARIAIACLLVLAISMAAALLWIFLGHITIVGSPAHGGFRDAGDRVASGVVMGICLLLFGFSSIVGWLGVSWLVM